MSYFVLTDNFRRWLNRAQCALVSKNKVRKDLWIDFCEIILFDPPTNNLSSVQISQTSYTSISTFLQTEGRSDSLKDDSILNWVTTLHDLRKLLNEEIRYTAQTRPATPQDHNEEHKYVQRSTSHTDASSHTASSSVPTVGTFPTIHTDTAPSSTSTSV